MRFIKIDLSKLKNEQWFGLFTKFLHTVNRFGAEVLGIAELLTLLVALYGRADILLLVLRKSAHTAGMEKAARERSAHFRGLFEEIKLSRTMLNENLREAAERLYILVSGYRKNILNTSYSEASPAVYNFIEDLKGKYAADVAALGLGKRVEFLEAAEAKFQEYWEQRSLEKVEKPKENLADVRIDMDEIYRSITEVIYAKLLVKGQGGDVVLPPSTDPGSGGEEGGGSGSGPVEEIAPAEQNENAVYDFVIAWNEVLKEYHNMLAQRAGRRKAKQEEDTEEEEEEETPEFPDDPDDPDDPSIVED